MTLRWAVVGGGILGMNLAQRLVQAGHDVTIIEAAPDLGGLAKTWRIGDIEWDRHYHVILQSDRDLRRLLGELDLDEDIAWRETRTGCYADGQVYSVSNTLEFLRFPPLRMLDRLRLGLTMLYASQISNWRRLESITVEKWLTRWSGKRAFEVFWLPLLRSKLGENHQKASAAFIWAIIQRLYSARQSGMKREMFGYVKGGYKRILQVYESRLREMGVQIVTDTPVSRISSTQDGIKVEHATGEANFDRVVVTVPAPLAASMIEGISQDEIDRLESVIYQGIVCPSLLLDGPLGGFYVTNLTEEAPFTGVIEMSALVDASELNSHTLVYLPKYTVEDDPIRHSSDEEIIEEFTAALASIYPQLHEREVLAARVSRVRHVLPVSTLGYSHSVPAIKTAVPDVYVVNSSQIVNGTLNVNETLQLAHRAFDVITPSPLNREAETFEPIA